MTSDSKTYSSPVQPEGLAYASGQAPTGNQPTTIPSGGAWQLLNSSGTLEFAINGSGQISTYGGASTAGFGNTVPVAATIQKSETGADTNVLTFTPPASIGSYGLTVNIAVSAANTATLGLTLTYTDANGHAQTPTNIGLSKLGTAAPALTFSSAANDNYSGYWSFDTDNSATNIVVKTTFTGTSIAYLITAILERLN